MTRDIIPVRLPSSTKAVVDLPRPFTVADATQYLALVREGFTEDQAISLCRF